MPKDVQNNDGVQNTFEIGLCMAGAISAGAYTAGVVDFLFEALEAWQQAKNDDKATGKQTVLSHDVVITCMSGASAGGMTAAAIVSGLPGKHEPVNTLSYAGTPAQDNIPYKCWVESVDVHDLLGLNDIGRLPDGVSSLLDCERIDWAASTYMKPVPGAGSTREYIADELQLFLTLGNLRGIPYKIRFKGEGEYSHQMTLHKDYIHFVLSADDFDPQYACIPGLPIRIDPAGARTAQWDLFRNAALATGAFPLALKPRTLDLNVDIYDERRWAIPSFEPDPDNPGLYTVTVGQAAIVIDWERIGITYMPQAPYKTLNVDGGLFNNEPVDLARRCLAGEALNNPRDPDKANKAVLLIDPFPYDSQGDDPASYDGMDVFALAMKILGAIKTNARFKPEDLVLAQDEDCYSRFVIGPVRDGKEEASHVDIACGSLGGFGGFFSKKFRKHDYQLGRRNCQWFLFRHFVIPLKDALKNQVFRKDWGDLGRFAYDAFDNDGNADGVVPIIPLMPPLCPKKLPTPPPGTGQKLPRSSHAPYPDGNPVQQLPWDQLVLDENALPGLVKQDGGSGKLRDLLTKRIKKVAEIYINRFFTKPSLAKEIVAFIKDKKSDDLADWLLDVVKKDFQNSGVMRK